MNTGPNFSYWQIFFPVLCLVIYLSLWGESKQKCWRVVTQQWRRKMNTPCDCKHSHNLRSETLLNQVRRKKSQGGGRREVTGKKSSKSWKMKGQGSEYEWGTDGESRQELKPVFTLQHTPTILQELWYFLSHSWGLLPGRVLQKRFRLHNPLLPEKLSEKRTREAQLIVLYAGITLTCCSRPVSTRYSACGGQSEGGWEVD